MQGSSVIVRPSGLGCVLAALGVLVVQGCGQSVSRRTVAEEWSKAMREVQIQPVFPPREDVRVGDVYSYTDDTKGSDAQADYSGGGKEYLPIPIYIGHLNCLDALHEHYKEREQHIFTGASPIRASVGSATAAAVVQEYRTPDRPIHQGGPWNRLPYVSYPEFTNITFSTSQVGVVAPLQYIVAVAGFTGVNYDKVTLKIEEAESESLPAADMYKIIGEYQQAGHPLLSPVFWPPGGTLLVVNEVFYARKISMTAQAEEASQTGLSINAQSLAAAFTSQGNQALAEKILGELKNAPAGTASTIPFDQLSPEAKVKYVEYLNSQFAKDSAVGFRMQLASTSSKSIQLIQTFPRPVAIGVRQFLLTNPAKPAEPKK